MSLISVRNVWKEYGRDIVLERINLEVKHGEFCSIVGASGCGKTTFLRMLLSQETPSRGEILLDGVRMDDEPNPDRGVVFQRYSVFQHLTVQDNVILGLEFAQSAFLGRLFAMARRRAIAQAEEMLEAVGLTRARHAYPASLSGGMQQRLAIAQALIRRPKILLLDEPFGALDPGTRASMHELIRRLWRATQMTIFLVTHDLSEGFQLGTRLLVFDKVRVDPDAPNAYGATVTYDLALEDRSLPPPLRNGHDATAVEHRPNDLRDSIGGGP